MEKTTQEEKEIIAKALKVNIDDVTYDRSSNFKPEKNKFIIKGKVINKFDIHCLKDYELSFLKCQIKTKISIRKYIEDIKIKSLLFNDCSINSIVFIDDFSCDNMHFLNCSIDKISCSKISIKGDVKFKKCSFVKEFLLDNCKFLNAIYFNNSFFKSYADFHECEFDDIACFYGVTFEKTPNFSQAIFEGNLNMVNTNLNFTFDDLQERIKQEYKDFNKTKEDQDKKPLDKFANDFRDSFRNFKSALIKDNNLLDASNFHKYELYCKELELKNKKDKTLKDRIDKWQLVFYRRLCDHHTDLLKAFHNLLIVIMLFSMFSFVLDKFKQPSHIENDIKYNIIKVDSNENYIFKEHNKTTYNLLSLNIEQESDKIIKNDFVYMIVFLILVLLLLSFNIFASIYIFGSILYLIFSFLDLLALYTHIAVIVFLYCLL
ncbi:pentapeptide repeat-containing protein [Campylobacter coli]|uniref:pentapeptide repeat-containing protein n=1 Tax=Campylobacter coli TaxID=195 RepID=UPI00070D8438|nr:pentapeptide repeat-containing protein [Campylobacter coli]MCD4857049.1 pentapeptide repeat-containing protein [Campylobacter coli]MCD4858599.1 pentapeptide repeat-containing protein [Campylobacter coli]MCD4861537.1 pentapeptide repeat-containing protein [Campylobacter coli]